MSILYFNYTQKTKKSSFLLRIFSVFCLFLSFGFQAMAHFAVSNWNGSWYLAASIVTLTLSLVALIISYFSSLFDIRLFSLSGFTILFYVLMLLLPSPWIYADFPDLARDTYLVIVITSLLLTIIGMCVFHLFFVHSKANRKLWFFKKIIPFKKIENFYILFLLIFSLALLFAYIKTVEVLPIVKIFQEKVSAHELAVNRENAFKLLDSPLKTPLSYVRNLVFPMVSSLFLIKTLQSRKYIWFWIFILAFAGNIFLASATMEKSPVVVLVIQMALLWLIYNHQKLNLLLLISIVILSLSFPIFVLMSNSSFDGNYGVIYNAIFNRIFYVPSHVLIAYVDYFTHSDFLGGRTIPIVGKYLLGGNTWIENIIGLKYFPFFIESVNANVGYPGYFWADFGWLGVILGSLLCGLTVSFVEHTLLSFPKSPFVIALYLSMIRHCFYLSSVAFPLFFLWFVWGILLISPSLILHSKYNSVHAH